MGLSNMKFVCKSKNTMLDKGNFTSESFDDSELPINNNQEYSSMIKSTLKNIDDDRINQANKRRLKELRKLHAEISVETITDKEYFQSDSKKSFSSVQDFELNKQGYQIEKLGLHPIHLNQEISCFSGVIYLPECYTVLAHYLTLYRLKLDTVDQQWFENWCIKVGHLKTARKYLLLRKAYLDLKTNYFKESFIINKILSRQSVQIRISDSFGHQNQLLRAFIVLGKRLCNVKSIIDCYCFNIKGKVPFIIRSELDYKTLVKSPESEKFVQLKDSNMAPMHLRNGSEESRLRLSSTFSKDTLLKVAESPSHFIEIFNIHPNTVKSSRYVGNQTVLQSDPKRGQLSNYVRFKRPAFEPNSVCRNYPIIYNGITYNLASIINDKTYGYILCKNNVYNFNSIDETDFKTLIPERFHRIEGNQSNSISQIEILRNIIQSEIADACAEKYYGVSLKQVPCGQFYVVQCIVNGHISDRESLFNKILIRNIVCGKIISKEYNMGFQESDLNCIIHLHGNESHVLHCSRELKIEGLARNFKVVHPFTGKSFQETFALKKEVSLRDYDLWS